MGNECLRRNSTTLGRRNSIPKDWLANNQFASHRGALFMRNKHKAAQEPDCISYPAGVLVYKSNQAPAVVTDRRD